jgi:F-type H+-transporting ATPase subunit b
MVLAASGGNFLIPDGTFIAELIAFLIIVGILGKWVLPPLQRAMEQRQTEIKSSLEAAEQARAEADETHAQRDQVLAEARRQAHEIVAAANQTAEQVRAEAVERGQREHDRLVHSAEVDIAAARRQAVEEVSAQVGQLVVSVARQVIGREVDAQAHHDLISAAVAGLQEAAEPGSAGARAANAPLA